MQTVVAQTPDQMDQVNTLLLKIEAKSPNKLTQIRNVAFWAVPIKQFPVNAQTFGLLSHCANLKRLIIGKGQNAMWCSPEDFKKLEFCKHLELLEIDQTTLDCKALSVVQKLSNLVSLRIRGIDAFSGPALLSLLVDHIKLKRLGIWTGKGTINDLDIISLEKMTQLTELILSNCVRGKENGKTIFAVLKKLPLKHLGLFYSDLDDSLFKELFDITSLTSFHVGGCWNLTSNTMKNIINLVHLVNFSISRSSLNKDCMVQIALNTQIRTLRISACPLLADEDLAPLRNMKITRLDLDNTRLISDATLKNLSQHTQLEEIYMMGIPCITDAGVALLESIATLKTLFIKKCNGVTNQVVEYLNKKKPNLAITLLHEPVEPVMNLNPPVMVATD